MRAEAKVPATEPDLPRGEHPTGEYTRGEEIANSVTHGIGVVVSIVALTLLIVWSIFQGDGWALGSGIVFGISLILLYTGSTLYHAIPFPRARHVFKVLDHSAIYLLIAGTYTPFAIVTLRDVSIGSIPHVGWWLFATVWALAATGISTEAFWTYRPRWVSTAVYLLMGWLVILIIGPVRAALAPAGLTLLLAGGVCYTLGTAFYLLKRVPYFHMVWHLWVIAGSVCHFLAVLLYVIPLSAR